MSVGSRALILLSFASLSGAARAQYSAFTATLNGAQEVPPTPSTATGSGTFSFDASTNTLNYNISFSGLTSTQLPSHLHQGAPGVAGPNFHTLPLGSPASGSVALTAAQVADLLAGNTYANIHTMAFSGGEIRGQIVMPSSTGIPWCFPGMSGTLSCPCSNPPGGPGRGCDNSSATGGATLVAQGSASLSSDTLVFTTIGEKPTASSILLQGLMYDGVGFVFGQGVRCVDAGLKRLYLKSAVNGSIIAPDVNDPRVSTQSANLGNTITAGSSRTYMVYYRDSTVLGGCSAISTFNSTNTVGFSWAP